MYFGHFTGYYHYASYVEKFVSYTETSMDIFILLVGFTVGWYYYPRYIQDSSTVTRRLLNRALQILLIQYILIFTINLPLYYILYDKIRQTEPLRLFLMKSMLFLNQIGIIHVLPTFIPLFLISPLILYLFRRRLDSLIIGSSLCLFIIGNKYPYALDLGEKTIFPFIVWQVYFFAGCFLGKISYYKKKIGPENVDKYFYMSVLILFVVMFLRHAKVIPPNLVSTHPLNVMGLLYRASIVFFIYTASLRYWSLIKTIEIHRYVLLFGRHALLVFGLHVYLAKSMAVLNHYYDVNTFLNYFVILVFGPVMICKVIMAYERRKRVFLLDELFK